MLDIVVIYPQRPSRVQRCQRVPKHAVARTRTIPVSTTLGDSVTKRRAMMTAGILAMVTMTGGIVEAQNPTTVSVLRARADSLLRQRNFDAAAGLYRQILERDSNQIGVFMGLGRARSGSGQMDEAIGWYRRALDAGTAPQNLIAYLLAQLYARRGEPDSTIAWLNRSLAFRLERLSQIAQDSIFARWRDASAFRQLARLGPGELLDCLPGRQSHIGE